MMCNAERLAMRFVAAVLLVGAMMTVAQVPDARADDEYKSLKSMASNAKWKNECGACHVAYPPDMLYAESWRAIMSGLEKHFGSNAGLDAATASEISAFLEQHARSKGHAPAGQPLLRITETPWFKSEHREVAARHWKNPKVKSPANCGACHPQADVGDFSEDDVKIPR